MIFAILFFASFVIGLLAYVVSERWWLGGALVTLVLLGLITFSSLAQSPHREMALFFGIPIAFFGSLFGAYIVQLRRGVELDELDSQAPDEQNDEA